MNGAEPPPAGIQIRGAGAVGAAALSLFVMDHSGPEVSLDRTACQCLGVAARAGDG